MRGPPDRRPQHEALADEPELAAVGVALLQRGPGGGIVVDVHEPGA